MYTKNLPVEYHQQDTDYYCGAACAQMVLDQIGAGLLPQDTLYNDNHSHSVVEPGWATAPDGLDWTMNNLKPGAFHHSFIVDAMNNADLISERIVWNIYHDKVAVSALVYGSAHWIVVRGFDSSLDPDKPDKKLSILGFYLNNPWPPTPQRTPPSPPPPHSPGDICGSGGIYGIANEHISYATWKTDYMTGVPGGHWGGKFVAICNPITLHRIFSLQAEIKKEIPGDKIIDKKSIPLLAAKALANYGFEGHEFLTKALSGVKPQEAILVERLDRENDHYYITPFADKKETIRSLVNIDARSGNYKQSFLLPENSIPPYLKNMDKTAILELLGPQHDSQSVIVHPNLVWKPCEQSLSPYWPFHMVTVKDTTLYIRIDGRIFTALTTGLRGL